MNINETLFCTGSADGDIKLWELASHRVVHTYQAEHARHGLFKNISQGVAQVHFCSTKRESWSYGDGEHLVSTRVAEQCNCYVKLIKLSCLLSLRVQSSSPLYKPLAINEFLLQLGLIDGTLYSCGADGSMKMRKLPDRDVFIYC